MNFIDVCKRYIIVQLVLKSAEHSCIKIFEIDLYDINLFDCKLKECILAKVLGIDLYKKLKWIKVDFQFLSLSCVYNTEMTVKEKL